MEVRFEEISKKYRVAKSAKNPVDLLSLKLEIESYIKNLTKDAENEDPLAEAQDMLIDLAKIIEESRCHPFRPKKI